MLGKLCKYELRSSVKSFGLVYGASLCFAVALGLMVSGNANITLSTHGNEIVSALFRFLVASFMALTVCTGVLTIYSAVQRFYKSYFSGEGYLMHSLPVDSWQLIISKLLIAQFWAIISIIVTILSMFLIIAFSGQWAEMMKVAEKIVKGAWEFIRYYPGKTAIYFLNSFLSYSAFLLLVYASIAIGYSQNKRKTLLAVMFFVLVTFVLPITLSGLFPAFHTFVNDPKSGYLSLYILLRCVVYYVLTAYFLKNKLNLE